MTSPITQRIKDARARSIGKSTDIGITPELISNLVDTFYGNIQQHAELGPIFKNAVTDWDPHLATMKRFWSSVALHDGSYSGRPVPVHMKLKAITPELFDVWLALFDKTLIEIKTTDEARTFFNQRAARIAKSLQLNIFYNPAKSG